MDRLFLQQVLATALRRGGTFAEVFVEDRENTSLSLRDGAIEDAGRGRVCGAGVRVFDGLRCIYCYTAGTDRAQLLLHGVRLPADGLVDGFIHGFSCLSVVRLSP